MVSRSSGAPDFEKLTLGQIDARTDEEFFSAVPPEVQYLGFAVLEEPPRRGREGGSRAVG